MSDWENGNGYKFQVIENDNISGYTITNGKYSIDLTVREETVNMICNLLNDVILGNGDGISKYAIKKRLDDLYKSYFEIDKSFTETMIVENIFKEVYQVVFDDD